jgi:hypothetical protein
MPSFSARRSAVAAICLAAASCAAPSNDEQAKTPAPPPEIEEALKLSVDALDVRHGSLRIEGSMLDGEGSADVSMWLGESCEPREVGRGIATRSGFAWSLSREEVGRAIECSLVVKVRAVDEEGQRVRRVAMLPVSVQLEADGADAVRLFGQESTGASTKMTFLGPARATRLHVAGTIIGVETEEEHFRKLPRGAFVSSFVVGNDDLARSMLSRRHLSVLGEDFLATITVGSMTLDVSDPVADPPGSEG